MENSKPLSLTRSLAHPFQLSILLVTMAAVATVSAFPQHGGHGDPYKLPPRPFHYAYGVKDSYAGTDFDKKESQDKTGNVEGQYRVALPDGRTQTVTYHADHYNGFVADVKYEGHAAYPDHVHGGGGYKHAPAPHPHHARF